MFVVGAGERTLPFLTCRTTERSSCTLRNVLLVRDAPSTHAQTMQRIDTRRKTHLQ